MKTCPNCQAYYPASFTHCPRDGSALSEVGAWQEGMLVRGKYRILGKVGEGGMAVVYKAMHVRFEELRALKVMNEELARDRGFVKRFMHEAVLTRKLQHPSAVRVDDIDEAEDGRPFIVMEFVEGRSLKDVIQREAPMAVARVCPLIRQIAGALDAAHRMGIVHRDVKPANVVLLTPKAPGTAEQVKLLDFGIAKAREGQLDEATRGTTLTGTGHVIGTPAYMSPEQARGMRGDQIDGRSDIYSLAIVMYEMLIGALPFKADTSVQWILAHLQTPPRPLWEARPELQIPYAITEVVMRCLEKEPQNRPPGAAALVGEIERAEHAAAFAPGNVGVAFHSAPTTGAPMGTQYSGEEIAASLPSRITGQTSKQRRGEFFLEPEPKSRAGWILGVVAGLVIAGGLVVWKLWPRIAPAVGGNAGAPAVQIVRNPAPNGGTGQALTNAPAATTESHPVESSQTENASVDSTDTSTSAQGTGVDDKPAKEINAPSRRLQQVDKAADLVRKTPAKREPTAVSRGTGFAEALLRARDDENQGKFEDALREYEQAAALDPSDTALKQHIKHLREQVAKENELIH